MRNISVAFDGSLTSQSVVIDMCSFPIGPKVVRGGERAVVTRMVELRSKNRIVADVTAEEVQAGARMLLETPGVVDWAWRQP